MLKLNDLEKQITIIEKGDEFQLVNSYFVRDYKKAEI